MQLSSIGRPIVSMANYTASTISKGVSGGSSMALNGAKWSFASLKSSASFAGNGFVKVCSLSYNFFKSLTVGAYTICKDSSTGTKIGVVGIIAIAATALIATKYFQKASERAPDEVVEPDVIVVAAPDEVVEPEVVAAPALVIVAPDLAAAPLGTADVLNAVREDYLDYDAELQAANSKAKEPVKPTEPVIGRRSPRLLKKYSVPATKAGELPHPQATHAHHRKSPSPGDLS